ncbi:fibronectin type III domain-containing protein, partial [Olsenella sp. An290]|uniref:metallophosphoesterase n=1 Tax=Olsenella sp. An290 TaxID=1965625 RepID=UPI000B55C4D1
AANPDANWKIVTFHHSVYSVASHTADGDILQRRSELPVVFSELDIDAVLMGHDHVYTRTYLMDGTTPIIPENGEVPSTLTDPEDGQVLYITANSASGSKYYNIQNLPQNTFSAVQDQSQRENMTRVEVTEDSLTFTTYFTDDAQVTSDDVLDTVTIERTPVPEAEPQVDRVSLEIGATESARNFNWISNTGEDGLVQVCVMPEGWQDGDAFPENGEYVASVKAETSESELEGWNSYKATVEGLEANTSYVYRVGNGGVWSAAYSFETGDLGDGASFSFMFAGDPQIGAGDIAADTEGWTNTLNTMEAAFPETDFMISLGDQVNTRDEVVVEEEYQGFFAPEVLHGITLATNVGNHETYVDNQNYTHNYNMPNVSTYGATDSTGEGSGDYWFTYNGVLFMSLNSNDMNTSEHKAFMKEAIAA